MSVEKITAAAGIGKSTFYNFFDSKESYVCQVIEYKRGDFKTEISELLAGREKLTADEAKAMFRQIIFSEESAYQYLTPEDIVKIRAKVSEAVKPDLAQETAILSAIFNRVEGVRENPDFGVVANLLKIAALAAESRDQLHEAAYLRTQDVLFGMLFSLIFEEYIPPLWMCRSWRFWRCPSSLSATLRPSPRNPQGWRRDPLAGLSTCKSPAPARYIQLL